MANELKLPLFAQLCSDVSYSSVHQGKVLELDGEAEESEEENRENRGGCAGNAGPADLTPCLMPTSSL